MSMEPGLKSGDILLVARSAYGLRLPFGGGYLFRFDNPGRGDIIVFKCPGKADKYVKRVIAIPGDRLMYRHPYLYVNGKKKVLIRNAPVQPFGGKVFPVPRGRVFVLGDNTGMSEDSMAYGPVPVSGILGRVLFRIYPFRRGN